MTDFGIPSLLPDCLVTVVPTSVYAGGPMADPARALFLWRTYALAQARGMTVGFYVWDDKLERLWRDPARQIAHFLTAGVGALIEPDFSLWADAPLAEQLWNTYRTRWMGRYWQEAGIPVIPNLNWSNERSFSFAFSGIPRGCPVAACEARTAGQNDGDRCAFLAGLNESVRQVQPQHVIVYGGKEHAFWLESRLPKGPAYTFLESWTYSRDRIRRAKRRQARDRNQFILFPGGHPRWAEEDQADVQAVAALG